MKEYGINLVNEEGRITVDTLTWNGLAKKAGFETDDVINEFKIENLDRPNKAIIYPFSFLLILIFGYNNYKKNELIYYVKADLQIILLRWIAPLRNN